MATSNNFSLSIKLINLKHKYEKWLTSFLQQKKPEIVEKKRRIYKKNLLQILSSHLENSSQNMG